MRVKIWTHQYLWIFLQFLYIKYQFFKLERVKINKKLKKCQKKKKIFKFHNTNNPFNNLQQVSSEILSNFYEKKHDLFKLYIVESSKKQLKICCLEIEFVKFQNLIQFQYPPTCLLWNFEIFLYIKVQLFEL